MIRSKLLYTLAATAVFCAVTTQTSAQKRSKNQTTDTPAAFTPQRPKLVVGIVVDQMRYDFLYRYWDKYSENGFKKLVQQGYNCRNTHYNYTPTYTGPGHASIYTGATPAVHGIVGNDWYICETSSATYCTDDATVKSVGNQSVAGQMSPRLLLTTTIADELKLATNQKSKVIGVCLKDRGSIFPAGHTADAAYWYDGSDGQWITSTYYRDALPDWVVKFNNKKLPEKYLSQPWKTLLPVGEYTESTADDVAWEKPFAGQAKAVFPHDLPKLRGSNYNLLRSTPFGNTCTKDIALAAIEGEKLGQNPVTDFLAVSFSATDYVGHQFGPNSVEAQDTYLRLDGDIAELLAYLEKNLGKENVLVFLSADHGGAHVPSYMQSLKIPAGTLPYTQHGDSIRSFMNRTYGKQNWVLAYENQQIYLDRNLISRKKLSLADVQQRIAEYAQNLKGVSRAVTANNLATAAQPAGFLQLLQNGHNPRRSGDVYLVLQPGWFEAYDEKMLTMGSTHGSPYTYDTHVPLIWYGWKVQPGQTSEKVNITDIAPTLADLLHIMQPNGCTGKPVSVPVK